MCLMKSSGLKYDYEVKYEHFIRFLFFIVFPARKSYLAPLDFMKLVSNNIYKQNIVTF